MLVKLYALQTRCLHEDRISGGIANRKKAMAYNKKAKREDGGVERVGSQYQVYVNDISWSKEQISSNYQSKRDHRFQGNLPRQLTFDIPANVIEQTEKNPKDANDIIETFICNALTRKFMHEVLNCQIWILF